MTLRKKTILIIGLTLFGLILISYAISSSILLAPFIQLEEEDTRQQVGRVLEGISERFSVLNSKATDWASLHNLSELLDIVAPKIPKQACSTPFSLQWRSISRENLLCSF